MSKLLFISHNASRTGAPMLLLNLLELLKNNGYSVDVFLREGYGGLMQEFEALAPVKSFFEIPHSLPERVYNKGKRMLGKHPFKNNSYDLVLNNTITNGAIIHHYSRSPMVTYVHEMETAINHHTDEELLKKNKQHSRFFLYPSTAVKKVLKDLLQLEEEQLLYLPYYIKDHFAQKEKWRLERRHQIGINDGHVLIGATAVPGWRKGSDFFMYLANEFKNDKRFQFLWVGSDNENNAAQGFSQMVFDKEKLSLDNLHLIPSVPDAWTYMAAMDIFFLPSREDPYPLVVPEAAMMELPIVCFENTGGANEFIGEDCGYRLPYLDLTAAKDLLLSMVNNAEERRNRAKAARAKYLNLHNGEVVLEYFKEIEKRVKATVVA
jgi:glycosyltransferase involved in cell wall biosynthesis